MLNSYVTGEKLARYKAYLKREETDRPLLGCTGICNHSLRIPAALPDGQLKPEDIDISLYLQDCEDRYYAHKELDDDFPFCSAACTAIPWMEAIMGCPIMCSKGTVWAKKSADSIYDIDLNPNILDNPWFNKLLEFTDALVKFSAGRFPVGVTLMRGPADILNAMLGAMDFVYAAVDEPERMKAVIDMLAGVYITVAKAQLEKIPDTEAGYMCGDQGMRIWMPGKFIWLQEDAMALLSPALYQKLIYSADCRITENFGHAAFHLHATALWAIEELLRVPHLEVIELNRESATFDVEGTYEGWKKIQSKLPLVVWAEYSDDFDEWMLRFLREIPFAGVNFQIAMSGSCVEEAIAVKKRFLRLVGEARKK